MSRTTEAVSTAHDITRIPRTPNHGPTTSLLIHRLRMTTADSVTDAELEAWTGVSCRPGGRGYSALLSAVRHLEKERVVWRREPKGGRITRYRATEIVSEAKARGDHVRRCARRTMHLLNAVDTAELPAHARGEAAAQMAIQATLYALTSPPTRKRLTEKAGTDPSLPTLNEVLASIVRGHGDKSR